MNTHRDTFKAALKLIRPDAVVRRQPILWYVLFVSTPEGRDYMRFSSSSPSAALNCQQKQEYLYGIPARIEPIVVSS